MISRRTLDRDNMLAGRPYCLTLSSKRRQGPVACDASTLSRIGLIEPGMIGIMRPLRMAPKRDFEGTQECGFLPDFATRFSLFSGMGLGLRKLSPSMTTR